MMPNGFYGSVEEWRRLTKLLEEIDEQWEAFARQKGLLTASNIRNWPDRTIRWGSDIRRSLSLYLANETAETYTFSITAAQDKDGKRHGHNEVLLGPVPWPEMRQRLPELLEEGYRRLSAWTQADLVDVIDL